MPASLNMQAAVADVYAHALFELARASGEVSEVREELRELLELTRIEPTLGAILESAAMDDDVRAEALEKLLRGRVSDLVLNTLLVMNRHGRVGLLAALLGQYTQRQLDAENRVAVRAVSAVPLDADQQEAIRRVAREVSGREPLDQVEVQIDPGVIGGLILEVGEMRYDNSVRRHLRSVRSRLKERGELEFGIGGARPG